MALIEIDGEQLGLPFLIAWWIFPLQTVSHNQMVYNHNDRIIILYHNNRIIILLNETLEL